MKHRLIILVTAALLLSGCGVTDQDEPEPITTLAPSTTPTVSSRSVPPTPLSPTQSSGTRQVQTPAPPTQ